MHKTRKETRIRHETRLTFFTHLSETENREEREREKREGEENKYRQDVCCLPCIVDFSSCVLTFESESEGMCGVWACVCVCVRVQNVNYLLLPEVESIILLREI